MKLIQKPNGYPKLNINLSGLSKFVSNPTETNQKLASASDQNALRKVSGYKLVEWGLHEQWWGGLLNNA